MNVSDAKVVMLKGEKGSDIAGIEKTVSDGLVDVYTITLTDGTKHTLNVTNGSSISSIKKTGSSGLTDTYTVTLTNGNTTTFNINNGNGITGIEKTSTSALVDTYTINYSNGSHVTFNVTNGRGIASVKKTGSSGINDTYTITYNDGTTSTYNVANADAKKLTDKFDSLEGMTTGKFVSGAPCVAGNYYISDDKLYKCIANTDGSIPVTNTTYFTPTSVMDEVKGKPENKWTLLYSGLPTMTSEVFTLNDSLDNYSAVAVCLTGDSPTNSMGSSDIYPVEILKKNGVIATYQSYTPVSIGHETSNTVRTWGPGTVYLLLYGIK